MSCLFQRLQQSRAVSHTGHSADPYVFPGITKFHLGLLDPGLLEAFREDLTEIAAAILQIL